MNEDHIASLEVLAGSCATPPRAGLMSESELKRVSAQLKALAHPVRLRMVELIQAHGGEICVCAFEQHFEVKQPTISHHLKILREAGLLRSRQEGTWVHHSLEPSAFASLNGLLSLLAA